MKYIVYCTTCIENGKIYIGVHKTEDPDVFDGYIGNGIKVGYFIKNPKTAFQRALKKYGYSKFKRTTLYIFDSEIEAYNKEEEIVTIDFIKRRDNYNTSLGGKSSGTVFKYIYQYDLEGNYIKEWFGVEETAKIFKCNDNRFNIAIKEKRSAFNSFWSFEKVKKLDITDYKLSQHSEIYQYDLEGNLINIWNSVKEIQEQYQFTKNSLCSAKSQKIPLGGFYFVDAFINIVDIIKSRELIDCITDKSISKYDQNGNKIYTYPSIKQASKENNISTNVIKKSIQNNEGIWSFGISDKYVQNVNYVTVKIEQYDLQGNLIKVWDSISQCSKEHPKVRAVLKGIRNQTHGYTFKIKQ